MDIYLSKPVNKTASFVTSQSGCTDSFLNSAKEELKLLGIKKLKLMEYIRHLKKELGISSRSGNGASTKYPRHILNNPMFKSYLAAKEMASDLDREIMEARKRSGNENHFNDKDILDIIKQDNPDVFYNALKKTKEKFK